MASIENYKSYKFETNQKWKEYYKLLYPTPTYEQLEKIQRKWYKANIDQEFDINFDQSFNNNSNSSAGQQPQPSSEQQSSSFPPPPPPPQSSSQQQPPKSPQSPPTSSSSSSAAGASQGVLYHLEGILKILFFFTFLILPQLYIKILMAVVCIMAIIRNNGMVQFNKDYAMKVITTEFFGNLIFLIPIAVSTGFVLFLPIGIHFLSGVAEYLSKVQPGFYKTNESLVKFVTFVKNNRNDLILMKQKTEIYLFFYSIIGIFFGLTSIFTAILVFQYVSLKSKFNRLMMQAQYEFKNNIHTFLNGPQCPSLLQLIGTQFMWGYDKLLSFQ